MQSKGTKGGKRSETTWECKSCHSWIASKNTIPFRITNYIYIFFLNKFYFISYQFVLYSKKMDQWF